MDSTVNYRQNNSKITALRFVYVFLAICPLGWIGVTLFHICTTPSPGGFPSIHEFFFDLFSNNWGTIVLFLFNVLVYLFVCFWGFFLLKYQIYIKATILLSAFGILLATFFCLHPSLLGDRNSVLGNSPWITLGKVSLAICSTAVSNHHIYCSYYSLLFFVQKAPTFAAIERICPTLMGGDSTVKNKKRCANAHLFLLQNFSNTDAYWCNSRKKTGVLRW